MGKVEGTALDIKKVLKHKEKPKLPTTSEADKESEFALEKRKNQELLL